MKLTLIGTINVTNTKRLISNILLFLIIALATKKFLSIAAVLERGRYGTNF